MYVRRKNIPTAPFILSERPSEILPLMTNRFQSARGPGDTRIGPATAPGAGKKAPLCVYRSIGARNQAGAHANDKAKG